jgi:hypothetical protein
MHRAQLFCLILVLVAVRIAQAETIEDLIAAGDLEAKVVVMTEAPLYQRAPVVISIEVGTPHRFSKGVRVRDFAVPGTMVRPASKFAFNETRRRGGDSWAFQSWRFQLFSERVGALQTPAVTTFISVENATNGAVEGEVSLQIPLLEIEAPPGTEDLDAWVAATEFKVDESWEGVLETYQVGDAITRIRRFTIKDAPAMAIPASPSIELSGIQIYQAPALVDDKAVGGSLQGLREERVVFTVQGGGTHTIPGHRIHWFNLNTKTIEQIDFPERALEVPGAPVVADTLEPSKPRNNTGILLGGLIVLGVAFGFILFPRLRRRSWPHHLRDRLQAWRDRRRIKTAFMRAAAQQNSHRCLALLYKRMSEHAEWQLSTACATDPKLSAVSAALMANAYGDGQPPRASELQRLWEVCTKPKKQRDNRNGLRLNPGPSQ